MRQLSRIFLSLSALCFAVPAFAQGGTASETNWVAITAGFSMAIASAVCGLAQGKAVASATESLARNPAARPGIQFALILGSGTDRVARFVYAGDYFLESEVRSVGR